MSMGGCVECGAAGRLTNSMGTDFTEEEVKAIQRVREQITADGITITKELIIHRLHMSCKWGRHCTCQHGRNWEQDPDNPDVPAYLDALPADHPAVLEYEAHVGRKMVR